MTNNKMIRVAIKDLEEALKRNGFYDVEFVDVDLEVSEDFAPYTFRALHTGCYCDIEIQVTVDEDLEIDNLDIFAKRFCHDEKYFVEVTPDYNPRWNS